MGQLPITNDPLPITMIAQEESGRVLKALVAALDAGEAAVLATVVRARGSTPRQAGTKMLVDAHGRTTGTIGGGQMEALVVQQAAEALQDGQTRLLPYSLVEPERGDPGVCGGEVEIYLEPYLPQVRLLIIGCGHVGRALAWLAHGLGYRVAVTDDRTELVTPELIPHADVYLPGSIEAALAAFPVTSNTYVAAVTRNVLIDRAILPHLLNTPAPYIGIIGSRRRWEETKRLLLADGLSEEQLQRFHSPVGLELRAETPEEIAVSIMAEIIMLRRGGSGRRMAEGRA
ncbi:MAG: XdhC/CoxI family protein [Chloroflexota bacterium]